MNEMKKELYVILSKASRITVNQNNVAQGFIEMTLGGEVEH